MFPVNSAYGLPTNLNVGGGIATGALATESDQLPQKGQVDAWVAAAVQAAATAAASLQAQINNKPGSSDVLTLAYNQFVQFLSTQPGYGINVSGRVISAPPVLAALVTDANVDLSSPPSFIEDGLLQSVDYTGTVYILNGQTEETENGAYLASIIGGEATFLKMPSFSGAVAGGSHVGEFWVCAAGANRYVSVDAPTAGDDSIGVVGGAIRVRLAVDGVAWPIHLFNSGLYGATQHMSGAARTAALGAQDFVAGVDNTDQDLSALTDAVEALDNGNSPFYTPIRILTGQANPAQNGARDAIIGGGAQLIGVFVVPSTGQVWSSCGDKTRKIFDPNDAPIARKYINVIGNGFDTEIAVEHNLNTNDVVCALMDVATGASVVPEISSRTGGSINLSFASPPSAGQFMVTVIG